MKVIYFKANEYEKATHSNPTYIYIYIYAFFKQMCLLQRTYIIAWSIFMDGQIHIFHKNYNNWTFHFDLLVYVFANSTTVMDNC